MYILKLTKKIEGKSERERRESIDVLCIFFLNAHKNFKARARIIIIICDIYINGILCVYISIYHYYRE